MKPLFITFWFLVLSLFFYTTGFAQLINWNTSPRKGFVFQISNQEAQKLLTRSTPDTIFNGLLHTQVDTFDIKKGWTNRPSKGHFILATISENKLHCEYTSVFPYQVFLLKEYDALALQVLDLQGNVREDAKVKFKLRRLRVDPQTKTYRMENAWFNDENKIVTVELDGFRSVFHIEKHDVPSWENRYGNDDGPSFYSYMITDKNKYRPNEKVRFKSFALSQSRAPLHKELEIWLSSYGNTTKVGSIAPHRPGSYAGEFTLVDSLKLTLDRNYTLQLKERNGRVVSMCNFKYEDYELNGDKLEIHLSANKQYHPAANELTILATDANGLMLKDAKATVLVRPQTIRETFQPVVILKDTLYSTKIDLDPNEPTVVNIPSALFQKTNTVYEVEVIVINGQNQRLERVVSATHYYKQYELATYFSNDSLVFEILKNGSSQAGVPVKLRHNDEPNPREVFLPYRERINPATNVINVTGELVSREISIRSLIPGLELTGGIEKDSFNIRLRNPQKIEVSWYVYQGSELLQKGSGVEWEYKSLIADRTQTYYVELLYSFGGEERIKRKEYEFKEDYLNVSIDVPDRVYPGQQVDATINVLNQMGNPVNGVDLTAVAITGKLNYYLPDLPYYGNSSTPRSKRASYSKSDINKRSVILDLDYKKWKKRAGLDTMKYYQFIYPDSKLFVHEVVISDGTQFAPYVMQHGMANQIYVIEINRVPVYYSWAEQPRAYSFYVPTKRKVSISLRLYDRVLLLDSILFSEHRKTILSVDLDHLPEGVNVICLYHSTAKKIKHGKSFPSFTKTEIDRHTAYISLFKQVAGTAYLESGKSFTPLFHAQTYSRKEFITAGPIAPGRQTFFGMDGLKTTYQHSGGYTYVFEDNIVYKLNAEKLIPERLQNSWFRPMTNLNDLALTKKSFLESKYIPEKWIARAVNLVGYFTQIKVLLPEEKAASGFSALLFENCKTRQWISSCQSQYSSAFEFSTIPKGYHNVLALYNNGTYLKMDSINLVPYSKVVIDLNQNPLRAADSLSRKLNETRFKNCYETQEPHVIRLRHSSAVYGNIKGVVYDGDNVPIPGTNVVIKGTTEGTVTDADGRFAIDSDESFVTLVISFIGYETKEIEVQVGSEVSVSLKEDVQQLQEVVVTGYGMQTSRELMYALSGRVSGVQLSTPDVEKGEAKHIEKNEGEEQLYKELMTLNTIRSHFNDVGFWEPKLFTDKKGQSRFKITFPDDVTRWETTVYAMNRHLQTGTARKSIRSYKPIMAELQVPRFLTQGDSSLFLGRVLNYSPDKDIIGNVKWDGVLSGFEKDIRFSEFHTDQLPVTAVMNDSITTRYKFTRDDGYLDGEERTVPVVEQGVIRADGTLSILKNGEEVHLNTTSKESITAEFLASPIDIYAGEASYLLHYQYDCNEQLASKLIGLINYRLVTLYEGRTFKYDKDVNKIIARLLRNQNEEFLWSWWDVSSRTSYWISSHILRALKAAADAGYKVNLSIENIARKTEYKFDILHQYSISDADLLNALASWRAAVNYSKHLKVIDSLIAKSEKDNRSRKLRPYSLLKEKLLLQEVRQIVHLPFQRDTLLRYRKNGILGDVSFSDGRAAINWYDDEFTANTIAYRIVKRDSVLKELVAPLQLYFLSKRSSGFWNTYHSSNVLMTVLPDLIGDGLSKKQAAIVAFSGQVNATISKFPYRVALLPNEELTIKKKSGLPIYFMQYKKERVTTAKTGVEGFEIKTAIGNNQATLKRGEPVSLLVEVNVKKEASFEYVMIEVPIPGACSYLEKTQNNNSVETHREYFKDRTVIFCENMKSGKYTFEVQLLPRFAGKYFINPAQVSLMYVPVVNSNTDMKKVKVE